MIGFAYKKACATCSATSVDTCSRMTCSQINFPIKGDERMVQDMGMTNKQF